MEKGEIHNFNTSHVTVYPHRPCLFYTVSFISIHLMLLFIDMMIALSTVEWNFNTSHVTVYLYVPKKLYKQIKFQYISCYCLSHRRTSKRGCNRISIHLMLLFILSVAFLGCMVADFNTSHVTVYPGKASLPAIAKIISIHLMLLFIFSSILIPSRNPDFNTSHVTVYRYRFRKPGRKSQISIHLMLLFIWLQYPVWSA